LWIPPHILFIFHQHPNTTYSLTDVRTTDGPVTGVIFSSPVTVTVAADPLVYNVGGGGPFCGIQSVAITLDGSETDYTYQLVRDDTEVIMERSGSGSSLIFSPLSIEGKYTVWAFRTGHPGCPKEMSGQANVTITESSTAQITGLISEPVICDGDAVTISLGDFSQ
jgi:hypothetical protein